MTKLVTSRSRDLFELPFNSVRNITSPEDSEAKRKVYCGTAPAAAIVGLPNDENVRDYIVDAPGKKRRTMTAVHRAMLDTLNEDPDTFCVKNGGIVIIARDVEIDESRKTARLLKPSLINGAQTQGIIDDWLKLPRNEGEAPFPVSIKFEIIIADDDDLIGEISIARNSQNNVDPLSIAGKRGVLNELRDAMLKTNPAWLIRTSETDGGENYIDTPKLLQVATALIPPSIWPVERDRDNPNKVFAYSMRAKCLKDFQRYHADAMDPSSRDHKRHKEVYDFIIDMAPKAWCLYLKWKQNQEFNGSHIQQGVERDGRKVVDVADGLVFPILCALSAFVERTTTGWNIIPPPLFEDRNLIEQLKVALKSRAVSGNPWNMGKNREGYTLLFNWAHSDKERDRKYAQYYSNQIAE